MALSNAKGLAGMSMPQYDPILTSETENREKQLLIVQEDQDSTRVKNKLYEETSPLIERSFNKPSVQISAVPNANNLFELLIKRVELATPSEKTNISPDQNAVNTMDYTSTKEGGPDTNSLERGQVVNGFGSAVTTSNGMSSIPNGKASEIEDEISSTENISNDNRSPARSIFEHLRKNFRLPDDNVPATKDKLPSTSENTPIQVYEVGETSHTAENELTSTVNVHSTVNMDQGSDFQQRTRISNTHTVKPYIPIKSDVIVINAGESKNAAGQICVQEDGNVFPFTRRLKWMSQYSREESPSLPQQPSTVQSNGSRNHGNTQATTKVTESVHVDVSRTPGRSTGFQPFLDNTSGTSGSGPVSVRLQNGTLTSSLSNAKLVPLQIPKKEICVVIDPRTQIMKEHVDFSDRSRIQQSRGFSAKTVQATSVIQSVSAQSCGYIRQSNPLDNAQNYLSENTPSFSRSQTHRNLGEKSPSFFHSKNSQTFTNVWERRPVVVSSISGNHRISGSSPFSSNKSTSAFSSPNYHQQQSPRGNFVTRESEHTQQIHLVGSSFQPVRLERPGREFINTYCYSTSTNVNQTSLSCNETFPKSPDQYSINDRVFRPVSPTWTHPLFSSSISSGLSHLDPSSKSTASDADRDDFSYACALHESANSPDIERMLGSESPIERSPLKTPPSFYDSPSATNTVVTTSAVSTLRFSDSEDVRDSASFSDSSSTTFRSSGVSTTTSESCVEKMESNRQHPEESSSTQANDNMDSKKKRKLSLSAIQKRLEPKLPSPVREVQSSGDLYQDPSKLTREERALQRAMMRFSEMEMKEKVVPNLPKKKRVKEIKEVEPEKTKESKPKTDEKISSSVWLLKVKRKQKFLRRQKFHKKHLIVDRKPDVKVEPSTNLMDIQIPLEKITEDEKQTKIKKRKISNDDIDRDRITTKKKKFMNEAKKKLKKKGVEKADVQNETVEDHNSEKTSDDILKKKKKKKFKKLQFKKKLLEKHEQIHRLKEDHPQHSSTVTSGHQEVPTTEVPGVERKKSTDDRHRVISKTYMLIPSYQGFKDFQPVVIQSRTRNKRAVQTNSESEKVKEETKPKVPLLVVESVNSKPVKEKVVAENEEVEKLVTECLRVQGKWHGDELEQALKREEAELNEEVSRFRDAKKLSVNRTTGETILHKAARLGYDEIVKQCVLQGADPNAKDNAGWTPLHEACARGKLAVVKVLARYGADVNSQSNDGIRPIHDAAEAGHVDAIRVLLSYGADPFLVTYAGLNALACAKHPKTKTFLQEYCGDIGHPIVDIPHQEETGGWDFCGSSSILEERPGRVSGIWDDIPDCSERFFPEFEISDRPHLNTYNLPVIKDGIIVGRRNYLLLQELYQNGYVAKTTLQKKLKNAELLEIPWSQFLEFISENQICVKPSYTPEGTSTAEPTAQLVPLNYTIRKLLGIRIETCRR